MNKNPNKTIAEIVEEMRAIAENAEEWNGVVLASTVARLADDIDAAAKRERESVATPPRQCDVGTAEEQALRYAQHCDTYLRDDGSKPCANCPCCGKIPFGKCEFAWMNMPYEKGETDGSK